MLNAAPVPEAAPDEPVWNNREVAVPAAELAVVKSGFWPPARVSLPPVVKAKLEPVRAKVPVVLPIPTVPVPVVAMVTFEAPVVAKLVVPVEVRLVNDPAAAVV
jgi:hypothetical protein